MSTLLNIQLGGLCLTLWLAENHSRERGKLPTLLSMGIINPLLIDTLKFYNSYSW
jgi:hypothetical protein